jgi:glycosyltransferase involved in cell wall biosynthesis
VGTALGMTGLIAHNRDRQREMLQAVDRFVVLTDRAAVIVRANGADPAKVVVNRLGVDQRVFSSAPRPARSGALVIGYVGRFDPIKGVFDLAAAIRSLPRDVAVRVEFRGPSNTTADRHSRDELKALCRDDPRVVIAEAVPSDAIPALMRAYDVVCCPSRCLEGGPTVGLEALAVGTPVIAANIGGVAEMIEDGVSGRLIPPGDVAALAAAITEAVRFPEVLDRWRANLPSVRTMDDVACEYLRLYDGRA